jgi:hypothetical protein
MANIKLSVYGSPVVVLAGASEMNSLANVSVGAVSGTGTGVILDNTALLNVVFDFELFMSTLPGAPTLGSTVELHAYGSIDGGTTYATSLATGTTLPNDPPIGLFYINGVGTSQRVQIRGITLGPGKYKFAVVNRCGQAFPATLATVTAIPYSYTSI